MLQKKNKMADAVEEVNKSQNVLGSSNSSSSSNTLMSAAETTMFYYYTIQH